MSDLSQTDRLFYDGTDLDRSRVERIVADSLRHSDDGELYLEYCQSESFSFDDGKLKSASFDTTQGFGFRSIVGEATGFAHASELTEAAIQRAGQTIQTVRHGYQGQMALGPTGTNRTLYTDTNPLPGIPFEAKLKLLAEIDAYARAKDPRVRQVMATIGGEWRGIQIIRGDGSRVGDVRPLVRLNVTVMVADGDRMETGHSGSGGRTTYERWFEAAHWQAEVDEALRQALVNLGSVPAPAGEMTVVLGPGWPGVLLHEAIGHGLEGDFNRKKTSAFAGLMGQRVAAKGVTVVDDGTLPGRRGSITVDDEGTPSSRTTLIEDGILVGYLQDRLNARLMGMKPTGNGRRQSHGHAPMPRMTNTIMLSGEHTREEILRSVKRGLYAVNFGGGQVDITSGKFVFSASEAYLVEDGKIGPAVKGATLVGNGPDALTRVRMIGHDSALDPGIGTCGKDGQSVPVGVGQPTMLLEGMTVGGTAT